MRHEEAGMRPGAGNAQLGSRMDAPGGGTSPDRTPPGWGALPLQDELLDLLQSLTDVCADLRFRLGQVEARERIRDAIRKPRDLGIDY